MKNLKTFLIVFILLINFNTAKAAESLVAGVEGMFCLMCQEKLTKAFKDEFGSEATLPVSWEKGLGGVSVPTNGVITEEAFKKVVEKTGFKYSGIIRSATAIQNLEQTEMFINKNPGIIILKTF